MADKPKKIEFTTPRVRLGWPKLVTPDYGTKDHPKPLGVFKTKAVMDASDPQVQAFLSKLQPLYDAAIEHAKKEFAKLKPEARKKLKDITENPFFTELLDKETEEPTGEVEMSFSRPFQAEPKTGRNAGKVVKLKPVALFDARGKPITKKLDLWSGTVARITFSVKTNKDTGEPGYFINGTAAAGISFDLEAVQIIELASGSGRDASGYGFGAEEGGFSNDEYVEDEGADEGSDKGDDAATQGTPDF